MISLSTRAKEAIKTSLAIVIVYWIAMQMDWDKPYWAGFTVITINMLSAGVSLTKGITRTLGTLVGAVAGLVFAGLFPQDRWLMMGGMSLFLGFGTYLYSCMVNKLLRRLLTHPLSRDADLDSPDTTTLRSRITRSVLYFSRSFLSTPGPFTISTRYSRITSL